MFLNSSAAARGIEVDGQLALAWGAMSDFCCVINLAAESQQRIKVETFLHSMASIMYNLLDMHFEASSWDETIRLGLLSFSSSMFLPWSHLGMSLPHLNTTLREQFTRLTTNIPYLPPKLVIWLLIASAVTVSGELDNDWLYELLRYSSPPLDMTLFDGTVLATSQSPRRPDPTVDTHFIVMHGMNVGAAFQVIAQILDLACAQATGFNIRALTHTLPPPISPTIQQQIVPHQPYVDMLLWPSLRDRLLASPNAINEIELLLDMASGDLRVWGRTAWDPTGWEGNQDLPYPRSPPHPLIQPHTFDSLIMGAFTQLFPPSPTFTENDLPSLAGKVFIITGGNAGVGLELVKMLYAEGGTVYIACRSPTKITKELDEIKAVTTTTPGQSRLDILWNNAGISQAAPGTVTTQGHEIHMGTNSLGHFLLTQLLLPVLIKTAEISPKASVRVVFATSSVIELQGPPGGLSLAELVPGNHSKDRQRNYSASKAGCWFLASEFDRQLCKHGIVCLAPSPGTLRTKGWDNAPWSMRMVMRPFMHEPKMGAYTELWAGLAPEVTCDDGGQFVMPWGRLHPSPKKEIVESMKTTDEGGTGLAAEFWKWCEEQSKGYLDLVH
ncbi:hypothetical protein GQX73_g8960 [Xylaria multiplex]|uniref:NAD(P)-binding protein n=1 Tax=Xylaria multiplex TaxID=323545 RepID=A0A7C8INK5_9PEZI|nr:hypothetical protein GQX73_g8960 [Xylaria multiplex]